MAVGCSRLTFSEGGAIPPTPFYVRNDTFEGFSVFMHPGDLTNSRHKR